MFLLIFLHFKRLGKKMLVNMINDIKKNKMLLVILSLSFLFRILFSFDNNKVLFGDIGTYRGYGMAILKHGVMYNSAYQAPGYTYFLALIFKLFGQSMPMVYFAQSLIGTFNTGLIYCIAKKAFGERIGKHSALFSLLYWPLTLYSGILLSETLFMLFLLLGFYMFLIALDNEKVKYFVLSSFFFSLAALTRSIVLLFVFLVPLVYAVMYRRKIGKWFRNSLVFIIVFCIMITPWTIRNYIKYKAFIPVDNLGGVNLYIGNNERSDGTFVTLLNNKIYHSSDNDYVKNEKLEKAAIHYILNHPGRFVQLTAIRMGLFVFMDFLKYDWVLVSYLQVNILFSYAYIAWIVFMVASDIVFYLLGIIGLKKLFRQKAGLLILGMIFYFFSLTSLFYVQFRYRLPIMPFLAIAAAFGFEEVASSFRKRGFFIKRLRAKGDISAD
jgi:4-amino-4-deoxy-L-arabinose transferase-like glycosyltransferase